MVVFGPLVSGGLRRPAIFRRPCRDLPSVEENRSLLAPGASSHLDRFCIPRRIDAKTDDQMTVPSRMLAFLGMMTMPSRT
jgi:hypothetical protein